jgi:hypothetical protein
LQLDLENTTGGLETVHNGEQEQYITLVLHKSLMHHDSQPIIFNHDFYLFFPIYKKQEFKAEVFYNVKK